MLTHIETTGTRSGVSIKYKIENTEYEIAVTEYLGVYNISFYMSDDFWIEEVEYHNIPENLAIEISGEFVKFDKIASEAADKYEEDKESFNKSDSNPEYYMSSETARY